MSGFLSSETIIQRVERFKIVYELHKQGLNKNQIIKKTNYNYTQVFNDIKIASKSLENCYAVENLSDEQLQSAIDNYISNKPMVNLIKNITIDKITYMYFIALYVKPIHKKLRLQQKKRDEGKRNTLNKREKIEKPKLKKPKTIKPVIQEVPIPEPVKAPTKELWDFSGENEVVLPKRDYIIPELRRW
jgi:hypothetical protein